MSLLLVPNYVCHRRLSVRLKSTGASEVLRDGYLLAICLTVFFRLYQAKTRCAAVIPARLYLPSLEAALAAAAAVASFPPPPRPHLCMASASTGAAPFRDIFVPPQQCPGPCILPRPLAGTGAMIVMDVKREPPVKIALRLGAGQRSSELYILSTVAPKRKVFKLMVLRYPGRVGRSLHRDPLSISAFQALGSHALSATLWGIASPLLCAARTSGICVCDSWSALVRPSLRKHSRRRRHVYL